MLVEESTVGGINLVKEKFDGRTDIRDDIRRRVSLADKDGDGRVSLDELVDVIDDTIKTERVAPGPARPRTLSPPPLPGYRPTHHRPLAAARRTSALSSGRSSARSASWSS